MNNLEFFSDNYGNNDKSIFSKINKTNTLLGATLLKKKILNINDNISELNSNKKRIQKLLTNDSEEIVTLLKRKEKYHI